MTMSLRPCPEFAASADISPVGLEAVPPVLSPAAPASAGEGTGHAWVRVEHLVPGDVVIPRYGKPYEVEAVYKRQHGLHQVRASEGTRLFCLGEQLVLVRR